MAKRVMAVDDSATVRQVLQMTLEGAGYEVLEAVDGKDALNKLAGVPVDMMVTDLNMPNMDGITLITRLRALPQYKFTPIIMLTTESQGERIREGRQLGVQAWIVKPFRPEQLVEAVRRFCPA